ncbi:sugar phosphate isomerase/epimerase [Saccharopolyspora aridisoli]|uniref:Sugar phosphate isomerase/epimerase n=1 Tax=Saccharopolyspora aridisoli TaxID=2530385 RepID=A0A4R4UMY3_9PSEU|nr:metabolite traffic protein EboE [Saccharopolyspora aridisoli]TDC93458.1 sugar phosphate isomerase/epimerase [Saccharopolyspora aridisoli]
MRFTHRDGTTIHLAYCTNVHPAEELGGLLRQLRVFGGGIRAELGVDRLGVGLWLPAPLAAHLADHPDLDQLRDALAINGLEVVTLNAFPYQHFHADSVKRAVYHPDWTDERRLDYTLNCARVLARLLPEDVARGSISTLPLAWREPWSSERRRRAVDLMRQLSERLAALADATGRHIRVGLEPEPGCTVETTDEVIDLLNEVNADHVGLCLDACHLAVGFEDPADSVRRLTEAGIPIVKTQASTALHASAPVDEATRHALSGYAEDRFMHQIRQCGPAGITALDDLPEALNGDRALRGDGAWRVHFHVPIHRHPQPPLVSTRDDLDSTLNALLGGPTALTDHVEVETYTWSVLPKHQRPRDDAELTAGLAGELRWVAQAMRRAGLEPS